MNIFILSEDPQIAARSLCNKHVVKMIVESAQLLCNYHHEDTVPYKRTHYNHPCSKWARESLHNYSWLLFHAKELCLEYTRRYGKIHKSQDVIFNLPMYFDFRLDKTTFVQAVPDKYKCADPVEAYQKYYIAEKLRFCKWMEQEQIPFFILNHIYENKIPIMNFLKEQTK